MQSGGSFKVSPHGSVQESSLGVPMPTQIGRTDVYQRPSIRVFTLGRFQLEVAGSPLRFGRKAQRKPIDLLKLLIAYGGQGVSAEQIAEDLWPDAEGDAAFAALRTTLSRLRKLIGARAVLGEGRAFTLNPEVCEVDALTLGRLLAQATRNHQAGCNAQAHLALEDVLSLYRGTFLPGECNLPPVLSTRAKLHSLFLRHLTELGRCYEHAGQISRAMDLYRRGLEIDETAEDVSRSLMQCCYSSGRASEGIVVYRSCKAALRARHGVEPSAVTESAYRNLLTSAARDATSQLTGTRLLPAPVFGPGPTELSIAVLPFDDLSPLGDYQRLAAAVRETTISLLGTLPQLSLVTGPSSAARYLLQGSVTVVANRLRAAVRLIDARTGQHAWSELLDHTLDDVSKTRDQVAIQVAEGLAAKLISGEYTRLLLSPNLHAWKALTLAIALLQRQTWQSHVRAQALVSRVLELERQDPAVLSVQAGIQVAACWKRWTPSPARSLRTGEQILRRLLKRYGRDAPGIHFLPWACALRGDINDALRHASRHVDRIPESYLSHAFLGIPLLYHGRYAEALDKLNDAIRVRPQPLHWLCKDRAVVQFCLGRFDEAASGLARVLVDEYPLHRDSDLLDSRMIYVASLAAAGRAEQASHEARATLAAHPSVSAGHWCRWQFQPYKDKGPALRMERLLIESGVSH